MCARVELEIDENGKTRKLFYMVSTCSSFGGNSLKLEIGLGSSFMIKKLTIHWPSKKTYPQEFENVEGNRAYHIKEGGILKKLD